MPRACHQIGGRRALDDDDATKPSYGGVQQGDRGSGGDVTADARRNRARGVEQPSERLVELVLASLLLQSAETESERPEVHHDEAEGHYAGESDHHPCLHRRSRTS